jgi:hypothetical protein
MVRKEWKHIPNLGNSIVNISWLLLLCSYIYFTYKRMQIFDYKILKYEVWVLENRIVKPVSKHRHV